MNLGVRLEHVSVEVGGRSVLDAITCELSAPGTVVVGPAGCGKTSLLKTLCGLVPAGGRIEIDGAPLPSDPDDLRRARQTFGFVFQNDALFDDRDALANVVFPLSRRGVAREEAESRARSALEAVGLADAAGSLPEQLSGGMKKRLGIARAIVSRPSILLADDPLAGLDPGTSQKIVGLLANARALVIAAASDPAPFADLCPHLIGLDRAGRVALQGATRALVRSPDFARLFAEAEAA
jgi:phospholipid/cholesterol/gamma-HCH transport system ATP-binding protein